MEKPVSPLVGATTHLVPSFQVVYWLMCQIFRTAPGLWSAAGTWPQVQSHVPQSQVWVVMVEPSVEAALPTMMTVQASCRSRVRSAGSICPSPRRRRGRGRDDQQDGQQQADDGRRFEDGHVLLLVGIISPDARTSTSADGFLPDHRERLAASAGALLAVVEAEVIVLDQELVAQVPPGGDDLVGVVVGESGQELDGLGRALRVEVGGLLVDVGHLRRRPRPRIPAGPSGCPRWPRL